MEPRPPWLCVECEASVKIGDRYFEGPCGTHCDDCIKQHVKTCSACAEKFPEAVTPRFGCPTCKSENVSENNIVQGRLRVAEWDAEGEPADFRYPWREVDDTMRSLNEDEGARHHCNACDSEFELPERLNGKGHTNGTAA
jgi:hypothetical protein